MNGLGGRIEAGPPTAQLAAADGADPPGGLFGGGSTFLRALLGERHATRSRGRLPLAAALFAVFAAALDGGLAAANAHAQPPGVAAVVLRVAVIALLLAAALFAVNDRLHARMGIVLLATVPFAALWLMNGSKLPLPYTIGVLLTGATPALFSYLLLAHPTGRLRSRAERVLLWSEGGALMIAWALFAFSHRRPPLETPLLKCGTHCTSKVVELGGLAGAGPALRAVVMVAWLALSLGTLVLLAQRFVRANAPVRRVMAPVVAIAAAGAALVTGVVVAHATDGTSAGALGAVYLGVALATPVAILLGLLLERMFMARALTDLLDRLAATDAADVQAVMADALHDPTLCVAYRAGASGEFVDARGSTIEVPGADEGRAAVVIERQGQPAAAVVFDSQLAEQERYVQAAGEAAMIWLERNRLESDRAISRRELAVSRRRLQEAAEKERRRIQRDLHDGAQQRLLAMRAKVTGLLGTGEEDELRHRALLDVRRELGETLQEVRTLAEGVYPPLLSEYGLGRALRSVSRGLGTRIAVVDEADARFVEAVEGAVYFTCLEALQNAVKHAGEDAGATVRLWREEDALMFEVADDGEGFASGEYEPGEGIVNMNDRITAVGGTLSIRSMPGAGTVVSGRVPVGGGGTRAPRLAAAGSRHGVRRG